MANVNVINENNLAEDIAIMLDELLCQKSEKDFIDLLKTFNPYKTIWTIKVNVFLRKIIEKIDEEFVDDLQMI